MNDNSASQWRQKVRYFADELSQRKGLWSVKRLCQFLLEEPEFVNQETVVEHLHDYCAISQAHLAFHSKWSKLRNMKNIAAYDQKEINAVNALIESLNEN